MRKETMTPEERWLAVVNREKPDRIPMYYRATGEANENLMKYMGCQNTDEILNQLHVDWTSGGRPRYVEPPIPHGAGIYGRQSENVRYEGGTYNEA